MTGSHDNAHGQGQRMPIGVNRVIGVDGVKRTQQTVGKQTAIRYVVAVAVAVADAGLERRYSISISIFISISSLLRTDRDIFILVYHTPRASSCIPTIPKSLSSSMESVNCFRQFLLRQQKKRREFMVFRASPSRSFVLVVTSRFLTD